MDPEMDPACILPLEHFNTVCDHGKEPWQAAVTSFESCRPSRQDPTFSIFHKSHTAITTIAARSQNPRDSAKQCLRLILNKAWQYCETSKMGIGAEEDAAVDRVIRKEPPLSKGQFCFHYGQTLIAFASATDFDCEDWLAKNETSEKTEMRCKSDLLRFLQVESHCVCCRCKVFNTHQQHTQHQQRR